MSAFFHRDVLFGFLGLGFLLRRPHEQRFIIHTGQSLVTGDGPADFAVAFVCGVHLPRFIIGFHDNRTVSASAATKTAPPCLFFDKGLTTSALKA